jgi:hypothetical protein
VHSGGEVNDGLDPAEGLDPVGVGPDLTDHHRLPGDGTGAS